MVFCPHYVWGGMFHSNGYQPSFIQGSFIQVRFEQRLEGEALTRGCRSGGKALQAEGRLVQSPAVGAGPVHTSNGEGTVERALLKCLGTQPLSAQAVGQA